MTEIRQKTMADLGEKCLAKPNQNLPVVCHKICESAYHCHGWCPRLLDSLATMAGQRHAFCFLSPLRQASIPQVPTLVELQQFPTGCLCLHHVAAMILIAWRMLLHWAAQRQVASAPPEAEQLAKMKKQEQVLQVS
jgi:hypothetical protein